ncbi:MAG: hypothetical protein IJ221_07045 [Oscillibacter sp.]|nr:hypothetical protein [Oscillibacter sp.]
MNSFENNILSRCCHLVYHQLLTGRADTALASVERMTTLIRYMADTASSRTTLGEELAIVRTVFELYQADGSDGAFSVELGNAEPRTPVARTTLVYEVCQYGMELLHSGVTLRSLRLAQSGREITYTFLDDGGTAYGGMLDEEGASAYGEG